jgi:AcrR family transcriptional regulator
MSPPAGRGRPRSAAADRAILDAAAALLRERGYAATSMDAVATRAGVGKATIYRRYPAKADLAVAALDFQMQIGPLPDSGDTRTDIITLIERFQHLLVEVMGMQIFGTLLVEERDHPELLEAFRSRVIAVRRAAMAVIARRGMERGDLRSDLDLETVIDVLAGAVIVRRVMSGTGTPGYAERLLEMLWPALAPS